MRVFASQKLTQNLGQGHRINGSWGINLSSDSLALCVEELDLDLDVLGFLHLD
jgi:hypothetical protein